MPQRYTESMKFEAFQNKEASSPSKLPLKTTDPQNELSFCPKVFPATPWPKTPTSNVNSEGKKPYIQIQTQQL